MPLIVITLPVRQRDNSVFLLLLLLFYLFFEFVSDGTYCVDTLELEVHGDARFALRDSPVFYMH